MSKYRITLDGKTYEMIVEKMDAQEVSQQAAKASAVKAQVPASIQAPAAKAPAQAAPAAVPSEAGSIVTSPMPGTILKVLVGEGEKVNQGQSVMILEAMKMENEITAPKAGVIKKIYTAQGSTVQGGGQLFEIAE
jgi:biotin carboxyl carrier protein